MRPSQKALPHTKFINGQTKNDATGVVLNKKDLKGEIFMKVQELLTKINNANFDLNTELEIKKYIPIMDKKMFVMDVISSCTDDIDDFISVDRFKMNIYFDMKALDLYTNLEIADDFDEMVVQYDMLCESGMMNKIIVLFEEDYCAMCDVLDSELNELLIQNSIEAQVVKVANKVNNLIDGIGIALDGLDINTILPEGANINELIDTIKMLK